MKYSQDHLRSLSKMQVYDTLFELYDHTLATETEEPGMFQSMMDGNYQALIGQLASEELLPGLRLVSLPNAVTNTDSTLIRHELKLKFPEFKLLNAALTETLRDIIYITKAPKSNTVIIFGKNLLNARSLSRLIAAGLTLISNDPMLINFIQEFLTKDTYMDTDNFNELVSRHPHISAIQEALRLELIRRRAEVQFNKLREPKILTDIIASLNEHVTNELNVIAELERRITDATIRHESFTRELYYYANGIKLQMGANELIAQYLEEFYKDRLLHVRWRENNTVLELTLTTWMNTDKRDGVNVATSRLNRLSGTKDQAVATAILGVANNELLIPVIATLQIKFAGSKISDLKGIPLPSEFSSYPAVENKHITHYDCFSKGKRQLLECAKTDDIESFVHLMFNILGGISFTDGSVAPRILEQMNSKYTTIRCINSERKLVTMEEFYNATT